MPGSMLEALGHYRILDRIGAGLIGQLYRARDMRAGRTVAVRIVAADIADESARRKQFLEDASAAAALSHPNIAALYEIAEDGGFLFLVSEFVPGETLKNAIAGQGLNLRRALDHAIQLADALAEAHAHPVLHLDIHPDAVMVTPKGHAKFLDFGLSRWTASGTERRQLPVRSASTADTRSCVAAYMSPEQVAGRPVDARSDVFSLGVVLFEMLTGKQRFTGTTANEIASQILEGPPVAISTLNRMLPAELDAIVARALARNTDERYTLAALFAADLRAMVEQLDIRRGAPDVSTASVGRDQKDERVSRRARRASFWIGCAVIVAAILGVLWLAQSGTGVRLW
jgi:eukaryotic-like serine/threonine-protein kinase